MTFWIFWMKHFFCRKICETKIISNYNFGMFSSLFFLAHLFPRILNFFFCLLLIVRFFSSSPFSIPPSFKIYQLLRLTNQPSKQLLHFWTQTFLIGKKTTLFEHRKFPLLQLNSRWRKRKGEWKNFPRLPFESSAAAALMQLSQKLIVSKTLKRSHVSSRKNSCIVETMQKLSLLQKKIVLFLYWFKLGPNLIEAEGGGIDELFYQLILETRFSLLRLDWHYFLSPCECWRNAFDFCYFLVIFILPKIFFSQTK